jgi:SAM-dependent methyltransferase
MQPSVCPLCKSSDSDKRFSERGYQVFSCKVCKLFYIQPYPSETEQFRNSVVDNSFQEIETPDARRHYRGEINFYKRYFPIIENDLKDAQSILDVGCGTGHLLELLGKYPNLYRTGIELNDDRAAMAKRISGCEVYQIPIENFISERKFDVITLINVFSHIPFFDRFFYSLRSLLSKNGKIIIKTGELSLETNKGDMFDWSIPVHVHFLGIGTMDYLCRRYDLRIRKHDRIPIAEELFSPETWKSPGHSFTRNIFKQVVVHTPFALPALKRFYNRKHGEHIYSSYIVLSLPEQKSCDEV